jgi:glycosyltransferase involved in cell wall biosynthesis
MKVLITLEHHFAQTPDKIVWTQTTFPYSFWRRYLEVFDHVEVLARVAQVASVPPDYKQANGDRVSFIPLPDYLGPKQYLLKMRAVEQTVRNAFRLGDAVIMRVSSQIANNLQPLLNRHKYPYGVEVVADPYDVFAPNSVKHPLRPLFRWLFPRQLRRQCARACAAAYVTQHALQARYPCPHYSVGISDVDISHKYLVPASRQFLHQSPLHLTFVGSLAQLYKAPDVLINAVVMCVQQGIDLKLTIIGDGKHKTELEAQAAALGIKERVCFRGQIAAGDAVFGELDQADLFVLPSHQEGLPRAMVEAMARGLPCIGSTVGGIPELLAAEDMVPPGDANALAAKIREVVTNRDRMAQMSARNLNKAKEYQNEVLHEQRIAFYRYVREQTEEWLKQKK